jgi:hypothetical protein
MLTLVFGLIYVAEGTKATSFDYEISAYESEIDDMNVSIIDYDHEYGALVFEVTIMPREID